MDWNVGEVLSWVVGSSGCWVVRLLGRCWALEPNKTAKRKTEKKEIFCSEGDKKSIIPFRMKNRNLSPPELQSRSKSEVGGRPHQGQFPLLRP